ncbi:MAG: septum site-determining protein MinC [Desulfotignum sp.]|nr:septum site-determining protein MinC [Desulfobacteraceae bacterium]
MIHFENAAPVKLKGVGGGFWVTLDTSRSEELLITEMDKLFTKLRHLAVNANVVIDMGDARGHEPLFSLIKTRLIEKFEVGRVTTPPQKQSVPTQRIRQRDLSKGWNHHRSDVLMLRGRVRSGQKIDTGKHVVIFGDVNPGAEIIAGGDVVVLGRLAGKVHAGNPKNETAIVFALVFDPTSVKIGSVTAAGSEEISHTIPEFACVKDGGILVQDYMKTHPFRKMPWPEPV